MKAVAKNVQSLLKSNQFLFSGFGRFESSQLVPTIPTSTRSTWYPEPTLPINNSTTLSRIRTRLLLPQFVICDT